MTPGLQPVFDLLAELGTVDRDHLIAKLMLLLAVLNDSPPGELDAVDVFCQVVDRDMSAGLVQ